MSTAPATASWRLRLWLLTLGGFVCILAGGVETTALPLFVVRQAGGSTLDAGLVVGTLTFSSMLARPLIAPVTRIAGVTAALASTALLSGAVLASYPWVHSVFLLAVLRAVGGIGDAGFLVSGIAAACAVVPPGREGQATSIFTSANSLSLVGGSLAAVWLLALGGYRMTWYTAAALAALGGSIAAAASRGARPVTPSAARARLLHPAAARPGAVMALGVLPAGGFLAVAPLYAVRAGLSPAVVMGVFGGVIFVVRTAGSRLSDHLSGPWVPALAFASIAAGVAIIGTLPALAGLPAGTAVLALGIALCMPASLKLALGAAGPGSRVEVIGTMTAFFAAAQTAGAPLLGLIAGAAGFRAAFTAAACAPAAALLLHLRYCRSAS